MTLLPDTEAGPDGTVDDELRPPKVRRREGGGSLLNPAIMKVAAVDAGKKLDPRQMARNPVMLVVELGSVLTTFLFFRDIASANRETTVFTGLVALWLWFTVLFANFAEAVAEGRGKAQAETLRKTRSETVAFVRRESGAVEEVSSSLLQIGDLCVVEAGQIIPGD